MDNDPPTNLPICAGCGQAFTWDSAYQSQNTPGSTPYNPPGHGVFRPRAYCPNCGALAAEWHIDRLQDYNEWTWYSDNVALNTGKPLPPSPLLAWGKRIPLAYLPTINEHQLAVEKIKLQDGISIPKEQDSTPESIQFLKQGYQRLDAGDFEKAGQLFDQAIAAGLNSHDEACALGSTGLLYLWKRSDVERAFHYCQLSVKRNTYAYWQAHYILSLILSAADQAEKAKQELADAQRFAGTRWWEENVERELRTNLNRWLSEHGKLTLQTILATAGAPVSAKKSDTGLDPATKICPTCSNRIKLEARSCRYCQTVFEIAIGGYCTNCHQTIDDSLDGLCPRCHSDLIDQHTTSKPIQGAVVASAAAGVTASLAAGTSAVAPSDPARAETTQNSPPPKMNLWQLYLSPNGRIGRLTFFLKGLLPLIGFVVLVVLLLSVLSDGSSVKTDLPFSSAIMPVFAATMLLALWVWLMLVVKRFHDLNRSGWNILLWILPLVGQLIYIINLIELFFVKGRDPNRFGRNPDPNAAAIPYTPPTIKQGAQTRQVIGRLAAFLLILVVVLATYLILRNSYLTSQTVANRFDKVAAPTRQLANPSGSSAIKKSVRTPLAPTVPPSPTPEPFAGLSPLPEQSVCFTDSYLGLVCMTPQGWQSEFASDHPFADGQLLASTTCRDGKPLFMTSQGLVGMDNEGWNAYPETDVSSVFDIACGSEDEVWLAGYSSVARLDGNNWIEYPIDEILNASESNEHPKGIALGPQGELWLALDNSLASYRDGNWIIYREGQGLNKAYTMVDMLVDSHGNPWAVHQNGLLTLKKNAWTPVNLSGSLRVNTSAIDIQDRIWVGTSKNLWRYENGKWKSFNLSQGGKSDDNVIAIAVDEQGRAWVATHWGLNVIDETGKITTYHMHNSPLPSDNVDKISVLGDGPPLAELVEEPAGKMSGQFTLAGRPLVKARIEVCMASMGIFFTSATPCSGEPGFKTTTTDENGEFTLTDLPEGYYSVTIRKPDGKWKVYSCNLCVGAKSVLVSSGKMVVLDSLDLD